MVATVPSCFAVSPPSSPALPSHVICKPHHFKVKSTPRVSLLLDRHSLSLGVVGRTTLGVEKRAIYLSPFHKQGESSRLHRSFHVTDLPPSPSAVCILRRQAGELVATIVSSERPFRPSGAKSKSNLPRTESSDRVARERASGMGMGVQAVLAPAASLN